VTRKSYKKLGIYSYLRYVKKFGSWNKALKALGLEVSHEFDASQQNDKVIRARLRFKVFQRDGFKCNFCGYGSTDGVKLHADHIIPFSKGGKTTLENLQTLCSLCNQGKGTLSHH